MIKNKRWRLTLQFAAVTSMIFCLLLGGGLLIFQSELTASLDNQLDTLLSELAEVVDFDRNRLVLDKPKKVMKKQPLGRLACVQLYDLNMNLVGEHGTFGSKKFYGKTHEFMDGNFRVRAKSIALEDSSNHTVGYLQVKLPTSQRDKAISNYCFTMAILTFFGFASLFLSGYIFARLASKPLEDSLDILRQFTADAAHELGTPIATISAAVDNLRAEISNNTHTKRLNVIDKAAKRMNKLADDLMLLTKLGSPVENVSEALALISMNEVIDQVVDDFEVRYQNRGIELTSHIFSPCYLKGYRDTIVRLLSNLLENSLRYTDKGGTVDISVKSDGGLIVVTVFDTGIGIPRDSLDKLFNRFFRVDKARSREAGGSGLGLSIVKAIAELHNGDISILSSEESGTKVTVSLKGVY